MPNQNTSHLGMWALSLVGVFVSFVVFGTGFTLGNLIEITLVPFLMLFGIGALMALGPTLYLYSKVKPHMGEYAIERIILFTTHLLIFTFFFRWLILILNAQGEMAVVQERHLLLDGVTVAIYDYAQNGNPPNTAMTKFAVKFQPSGIVKDYEQSFYLGSLDYNEKVVLDANLENAKYAKAEIHKGLFGFDLVGEVVLDFDN